ncbi:hypothetical protein GV792_15175 [Nocardia cyriacigeorgica]|uniref:hypothetical protein n=1 Tax=Nocardia cyriacigeorgica TaxID=135487 RepID=UPI0013BD0B6C|nr:hypothetical protein [Nocardia cyriacigeorgica]NEW51383.1 hypothetical protein [Nocardia cyriacigeorgica]
MRTALHLAAASIAAASLVGTAATTTATPIAEAGTGSSAADSGSAAARSVVELAGEGDIIGVIVLLGITPFQMLTGGVCDLATLSALPNPCVPRY